MFCASQSRSLTDISEYLNINRHTLRTSYLYRMVKDNQLHSIQKNGSKASTRYRTSWLNMKKIKRQLTKTDYELLEFFELARKNLEIAAKVAQLAKHPKEKEILKLIDNLEGIYCDVNDNVECTEEK